MIIRKIKNGYLRWIAKRNPTGYARKIGVQIGTNNRIIACKHGMFGTEPYLVTIGNNCLITGEVKFITHDGSAHMLRDKHPNADLFGKITIGNNVFIGQRTILLPGISIGDNVVIGAGSVVTRSVPADTVVAGVPAKKIKTTAEYIAGIEPRLLMTKGKSPEEKRQMIEAHLSKG